MSDNLAWFNVNEDNLVYCTNWSDAESTVRAKVFGTLVELAENKVQNYRSDLFHDALWIKENVNGPMQFDWVVRDWGTHIGESVQYLDIKDWAGAMKYRFEIINDDGRWKLITWEARPYEGPAQVAKELVNRFNPFTAEENAAALKEFVEQARGEGEVKNFDPAIDHGSPSEQAMKQIDRIREQKDVPHEDLPVTECDLATQVGGCIHHPAPYLYNCTGTLKDNDRHGCLVFHMDNSDCPQHPGGGEGRWWDPAEWRWKDNPTRNELLESMKFPTPGNTTVEKGNAIMSLDRIIDSLEEKKNNATEALDELRNGLSEIEDEISNGENYVDELETLINSLNDLPYWEASVNVDVSFDSND